MTRRDASSSVVPASLLDRVRHGGDEPSPPDANTVVLDASELDRMRQSSVILSQTDKLRLQKDADAQRLARQATAAAHKRRMLQLETQRKAQATGLTDLELEAVRGREALVSKGKQYADEQHDDVKRMNHMVLYAKCVTIRDRQVAERAQMQRERDDQETLLDLMMEYERQKAITAQRAIDKERVVEQKKGAQTIVRQMHEREKVRLREQELKNQEGIAMLEQAMARERQAEVEKVAKHDAGKMLLAEIVQANQEQLKEKNRRKQAELAQDVAIGKYLKDKERREEERDRQLSALNEQKERQMGRLREAREKDNDNQAEIDMLRARRAQEATERKWREQQTTAARRQAKIQSDLRAAREFQRMDKERRLIEQANEEREQFQRMLDTFKEQERADKSKEQAQRHKRAEYSRVLNEQMKELEARRLDRSKVTDVGEMTRKQDAEDRRKLEGIKQAKIAELAKAGVPPKYQAELKRFKVLQTHAMS